MWNFDSKKGGDKGKDMDKEMIDWDEEMTEDVELEKDFKSVEEYVAEYDDGP